MPSIPISHFGCCWWMHQPLKVPQPASQPLTVNLTAHHSSFTNIVQRQSSRWKRREESQPNSPITTIFSIKQIKHPPYLLNITRWWCLGPFNHNNLPAWTITQSSSYRQRRVAREQSKYQTNRNNNKLSRVNAPNWFSICKYLHTIISRTVH